VSDQVKLEPRTKREVALFSAATGKAQKALLGEAWAEYRERHADELREGLQWAQDALANPAEAAVQASGMSAEDIDDVRSAFDE
jgi:hypothetical protein